MTEGQHNLWIVPLLVALAFGLLYVASLPWRAADWPSDAPASAVDLIFACLWSAGFGSFAGIVIMGIYARLFIIDLT